MHHLEGEETSIHAERGSERGINSARLACNMKQQVLHIDSITQKDAVSLLDVHGPDPLYFPILP